MARVLVIGATGGVGAHLTEQLLIKGHIPFGTYRRPEQEKELRDKGVEPVLCNLVNITVAELTQLLQGMDAVVFTAGAAGDSRELTDAIDGNGVVKASTAALAAGVQRFLLVSAFPDAWREKRMPESFEHYMFVKRQADVHLASTSLNWVILRPGTLLDASPTQKIRLGLAIPYGDVPRSDVASTIVSLIEEQRIRRVILELTSGSTPIGESVANQIEAR
ncbi:putative NADH-flavin reductase [Pseudomonas sp. JV551A1]|uniref:SDR family oxidoreductase n=1 Tax=Pseudomonas sp. JV551A1 TaxID=2078787 RepID=UPI00100D73C4|nr:SDR family oxidoreductase [Pseudomonas sp. JV551A1]SPO55746.1 putative NADH-flavin reductase [Pseudomonas sp. JV551A1]